MLDIITGYLTIYGYYFLFLATVIESIPFIGLVFPGEVIVVEIGRASCRERV